MMHQLATKSVPSSAIRALVSPGRVHQRVYADPEIFKLELERIFGRVWLYVAHESQLKKPGDFVRAVLVPHEVLVTRHEDGAIHILKNRCPHRGARLCMVDQGNSRLLSCPYHAWVFRSDGKLASVPHRQSYPTSFDINDPRNHLEPCGRVQTYRGFVFAKLHDDPVSLRDYLGPMTDVIDNLVDRAPEGEVELASSHFELKYNGNWKLHQEN